MFSFSFATFLMFLFLILNNLKTFALSDVLSVKITFFHMKLKIVLPISVKNYVGMLRENCFEFVDCF